MANKNLKFDDNAPGNFFVDSTCIDCGTCYWVAPQTFKRSEGHSLVYQQPENELAAYRALFSCPTNSIGTMNKGGPATAVAASFPFPLAGPVSHCGFHSVDSFGATSYFVKTARENILIDSPRFSKALLAKFESLGGIQTHLLTHKDDVADTDLYQKNFQGQRWIHAEDTNNKTRTYEEVFSGENEINLNEEVKIIPVPGHTKGSVCYLIHGKYLFTGDHLAYSPQLGHLYAFKDVCWYDFDVQIKSMEKLLDYDFEFVFPGHGAPFQASVAEMRSSLEKCLSWMKK